MLLQFFQQRTPFIFALIICCSRTVSCYSIWNILDLILRLLVICYFFSKYSLLYFFAKVIWFLGVVCCFLMKPFVIMIFLSSPPSKKKRNLEQLLPCRHLSSKIPSSKCLVFGSLNSGPYCSRNSACLRNFAAIFGSRPLMKFTTSE